MNAEVLALLNNSEIATDLKPVTRVLRGRSQKSYTAEVAFRATVAELGGTVIEPVWLGSGNPHRVRCSAGHECAPRPDDIQRGRGICRVCGLGIATAEAAFRARVTELGGQVLEAAWLGTKNPHRVRCFAGHDRMIYPNSVIQGQGICRVCAGNDPVTTEDAFRSRVIKLGGEVLEPVWLGANKPHRVRCSAGHECTPRPHHVIEGFGICQVCAGKIWDAFYIVQSPANGNVKFGITSGDPRPRLNVHANDGFTDIHYAMTDLPGNLARDTETAAIKALADAGFMPVRGREYYNQSALPVVLDIAEGWLSGHGKRTEFKSRKGYTLTKVVLEALANSEEVCAA